jgi:hypothetical protein
MRPEEIREKECAVVYMDKEAGKKFKAEGAVKLFDIDPGTSVFFMSSSRPLADECLKLKPKMTVYKKAGTDEAEIWIPNDKKLTKIELSGFSSLKLLSGLIQADEKSEK